MNKSSEYQCEHLTWKLSNIIDSEEFYDENDVKLAKEIYGEKCTDEFITGAINVTYMSELRREYKFLQNDYIQILKSLIKKHNFSLYFLGISDEDMKKLLRFENEKLFLSSIGDVCDKIKAKHLPNDILQNLWREYTHKKQEIENKYKEKIRTYRKRKVPKTGGGGSTTKKKKKRISRKK